MNILNTTSLESNKRVKINFAGGDLSSDARFIPCNRKKRRRPLAWQHRSSSLSHHIAHAALEAFNASYASIHAVISCYDKRKIAVLQYSL